MKLKEKIKSELNSYGGDILNSEEMRRACAQTHHTRSTVAEHTRRVAENSLAICHALEKLGISTDIKAVVEGALCHDLGILGREEKFENEKECFRRHADASVSTAQTLLDHLPEKTRDIIEHHMWPVAGSRRPGHLEGFIVSAADKAAAVQDFIMGSRYKPADLRTTLRNISERNRRSAWKMKRK